MKVLIGTKNPGKIQGAKNAFEKYFENIEIEGISVSSNVSEQPVNNEIYDGLKNRINNLKKYAKENNLNADFYIASEAGITNLLGEWININMAIIEDRDGLISIGISQGFPIPDKYVEKIRKTSLGVVLDEVCKEKDLSKGNGGISFLTKGATTRINMTENAFIMALTKHINGDIWK